MIKLHVPLWELAVGGAALYILGAFMIRGHFLKRRLHSELIGKRSRTDRTRTPTAS